MKHSLPSLSDSVIVSDQFENLCANGHSSRHVLGHVIEGAALTLDINEFIGRHTLIQAMSGGGKSFALRKMLEIAHSSSVPILVFDPEDEFATLKQAFPEIVLLGGEGEDAPVDADTIGAVMLALLETRASAVVQMRDFDQQEQRRIVANAIGALMQAPKALWRPLVIAIDEAQRFAPEMGRSESTEPIADLMRQGRKRHFSAIMATQRFSQVSKACITQASNILAGLVKNSTDLRRAELELGLDKAQAEALRDLPTGHFLIRGPALAKELVQVSIAKTRSPHGHSEPVLSLLGGPRLPVEKVIERLRGITSEVIGSSRPGDATRQDALERRAGLRTRHIEAAPAQRPSSSIAKSGLSETAGAMLAALAADPGGRLSRDVLGLLVQLSPSGTVFTRVLGELLSGGLATLGKADVRLTPNGKTLIETSLPNPARLSDYATSIRMSLDPDARRLLDALTAASPAFISPADLASRAGMSPRARKLKRLCAELVQRRFARRSKGRYAASPALSALMLG